MIEDQPPVQKGAPSKPRDNDGLHKRRGIWHFKLKVGGRWREISTRTSNYQQARKTRQQSIQAQEDGRLPTDLAKWPIEKATPAWLAERAKLVAPQTHRIDRERLLPIRRAFGGRRLCDITSGDIRGYQVARTNDVGPRTINLETKVLRMLLKWAKLWSRVVDDCKPLPENRRGPGRALSPDEEKRLFEIAASNPHWSAAYLAAQLAANTTARGCELKGLRLADVDLDSKTITVQRVTTKTDAGCRVIPLNVSAAWAVTRLLERAALLGARDPQHYLFPAFKFRSRNQTTDTRGVGYDPSSPMKSWRTAWRALTRAIECPACKLLQQPAEVCRNEGCKTPIHDRKSPFAGLRFHDLRHHCITRLAEAGVAEQTLMAIAGHVSREMLEHYSHIRMQAKRAAVAALEEPATANRGEQSRRRPASGTRPHRRPHGQPRVHINYGASPVGT
jgi:integrase